MAERIHWWRERWLECRVIFLSILLSIYPSIYLSVCLPIYLSNYLCVSLSPCICLSIYIPTDLSFYLSVHLSVQLSMCLSVCLSVSVRLCPSLSVSVRLCPSLSVSVRLCPSLSVSVRLCPSLSVSVRLCPSLSVSVCLCLSLSVSVGLCLSLSVSVCLCLSLSVSVCLCLSLSVAVCLSTHPSIYSIYLSICLSVCPTIYVSISPCIYMSIYLYIYIYISLSLSLYLSFYLSLSGPFISWLSVYLPVCLSTPLSIYLSVCLSVCLPIYLSVCLRAWKKAILRDFLNFQNWQHQKWSLSARLPQPVSLTTPQSKQFCKTSSIFEIDNIRKRSNYAKLPSKMTSWVLSWQPRTNAFWDLSVPSQYCVCHENMRPGHTKCCTCHAKAPYQTWRSDASKCNPSEEITALTSQQLWWTCLLYCACRTKDILPNPLQMSHACHHFGNCDKTNMFGSLFTRRRIDCAPYAPCAPRCTQQGCKAIGQSWNWLLGWLCPSAAVDISISLSLLMLRLILAMWVCITCRVVVVLVSHYPCKVAKLYWWHLQLRDQDCGRLGWRLLGAKRCSFRLGLCLAVPAWSAWFSDYFCRLLLLLCQFDWGCHWSSACTCACVRLLSSEAVLVIRAPPASDYFSSCRMVGRCGKVVTAAAAAAGTTLCFLLLTQLNVGAPPQYCMTMTDWDFDIHDNTVLALRPWQESPHDFIPQPQRYKCTMQQAIHLAQWMPRPACTSRRTFPDKRLPHQPDGGTNVLLQTISDDSTTSHTIGKCCPYNKHLTKEIRHTPIHTVKPNTLH